MLHAARSRWRRSLQARVVITTLVTSGVVVALLASLLLDQVGRGLIDTKTSASLAEAQSGLQQARALVDDLQSLPVAVYQDRLSGLVQKLSDRGGTGDLYTVVLLGPPDADTLASPGVGPSDIPDALSAELAQKPGPAYLFAPVPTSSSEVTPGLVVGASFSLPASGTYRLYYLFPFTAESATFSLVLRTAAVAGLLLVALLAFIAGLVARQVVRPVRMAARTAELLAAGRLEERMQVRGEDELARLGSTFNTMAEALQRQIHQLEDLSRVQRRFVSDVSHELRTPLTTVRMAADLLHEGRGGFPPEVARSAELLQAELNRFEELLVDLLEISRYDAGATSLEAESLDLVALVRRVADATQPLARAKGAEVDLSGLPADPVLVEGDHVRLERVVRNLVVNAVEHGEGRPVTVSVAGDDEAVAVAVRDTGVGLKPGEAALVFTRFWRGDPSRARSSGGTGLGLAIAMEDVRLHGGWLQAWGAPGQGAVFRMTLPRFAGGSVTASPLGLAPESAVTP